MKLLKYLIFILLFLFIASTTYVAVQPSSYDVSRTRLIKAPQSVIYDQIIDFKNWESWSPWVENDSTLVFTYPENTKGVGGSYSWIGKDGKGSMKTIAAHKNDSVLQQIKFEDFPASNVYWTLKKVDNGTEVTWGMTSDETTFLMKFFALINGGMDKMIGPDYERGLEKLELEAFKRMSEYSIKINGVTTHGGGFYLYQTTSCKMTDFQVKMKELFPIVSLFVAKNNITTSGAPFVIYHKWDQEHNAVIFSVAIPTPNKVVTTSSDILTGQLQPFKALKTTLIGDYKNLKEAWEKSMTYLSENNLSFDNNGLAIESYLTDAVSVPNPAEWITEIYLPIKD